jgi:hypothetical protein
MTEHHQQSRLRTADIAQKTEEDRFESNGEMERTGTSTAEGRFVHLLPNNEADQLRSRWNAIQAEFVDDPIHPSRQRTLWWPR